jgi:serine/threonine protein kinase
VPTALAGDILHKTPLSPAKLRSALSPGLTAVILKCLEKEPTKRYQSARELQSDLERLSTGASPRVVRRPWPMIATCAIVVVMLVVGAFFIEHHRPELTEKEAQQRPSNGFATNYASTASSYNPVPDLHQCGHGAARTVNACNAALRKL